MWTSVLVFHVSMEERVQTSRMTSLVRVLKDTLEKCVKQASHVKFQNENISLRTLLVLCKATAILKLHHFNSIVGQMCLKKPQLLKHWALFFSQSLHTNVHLNIPFVKFQMTILRLEVRWSQCLLLILSILVRPFGFIAPKDC